MGSSQLVDLGKQLIIELDRGCWVDVSEVNVYRITLKGDVRAMESSLVSALAILRQEVDG